MKQQAFGDAVVRSLSAPELFRDHFMPMDSWRAWVVVLRALFGLPLEDDALALFQECTGRTDVFKTDAGNLRPVSEAWLLCGRRSGKSRMLAMIAVCFACFRDWKSIMATGERPLVMVLAADRDQAGVIFEYARGLLLATPILKKLIAKETAEEIELTNRVIIAVHTSSYRRVRGRSPVAVLCDEVGFWMSDDSRNPAEEVLRALRPSLANIPGSLLLCASSTHIKEGALYNAFDKHWGKNVSAVLVWKADTRTMNPSFRQDAIDAAYEADAASAAAEYGSEFLTDNRQHFPDDDIDAAIQYDRAALTRDPRLDYCAFADMSGGVSDSSVLAIAHMDLDRMVVLDRLEIQKPPFRPEDVCQRFADVLSGYGLNSVQGDAYTAAWIVDAFRRVGVTYHHSELNKSQIFIEVQPLFTQRRIELLDNRVLHGELRRLERRPQAGGKDKVDHPRGSHDDAANAACGALLLATKSTFQLRPQADTQPRHRSNGDYDPYARFEAEQRRQFGDH